MKSNKIRNDFHERLDRHDRRVAAFTYVWAAICLGLSIGELIVAIHFISKYW